MKTNFKTDNNKIIEDIFYHDLLVRKLLIDGSNVTLILGDNEKYTTEFRFEGVFFISAKEIIPKGIVLSCYSFLDSDCPAHLNDSFDLGFLPFFQKSELARKVFYVDGTVGIDLLIRYSGAASHRSV